MTKLHGFNDAIHDHRGTEPGTQPEEQHLATLVAAESLHRGIIDDLDRALELPFKSISAPAFSQVPRLRKWPIPEDRPRVTDGYRRHISSRRQVSNLLDTIRFGVSVAPDTNFVGPDPWQGP